MDVFRTLSTPVLQYPGLFFQERYMSGDQGWPVLVLV